MQRDDPAEVGRWFAISYRNAGLDRITAWMDTLLGAGPGRAGVVAGPEEIRVRMGRFKLNVPRSSVRSVSRSGVELGGTTGVHAKHGRLLVNGSPEGLVELVIDPPHKTGRTLSTAFTRKPVTSLVLSLVDPDGFIDAFGPGRTELGTGGDD